MALVPIDSATVLLNLINAPEVVHANHSANHDLYLPPGVSLDLATNRITK